MSKLADYSQTVTVDQLDAALRAGGFEGVFHYLAGTPGFALRIEDPAIVEGIRARGWPQAGIDIPRDPINVDGAGTGVRARDAYGCPPGTEIYLDIEPARFAIDPASWPRAADGWCDAIRETGFVPGVYGTDATIAACANHADRIWRASSGPPPAGPGCDPAGPGLAATFFAGNRIVQCGSGVWGGVEFDVSFSQFILGADMSFTDADRALLSRIATDMFDGQQSLTPDGQTPVPADWPNYYHGQLAKIDDLEAAVAKLQQPAVDANAVAASLAGSQAFLDAIAQTVVKLEAAKLGA